jgi:hypothetical protein
MTTANRPKYLDRVDVEVVAQLPKTVAISCIHFSTTQSFMRSAAVASISCWLLLPSKIFQLCTPVRVHPGYPQGWHHFRVLLGSPPPTKIDRCPDLSQTININQHPRTQGRVSPLLAEHMGNRYLYNLRVRKKDSSVPRLLNRDAMQDP